MTSIDDTEYSMLAYDAYNLISAKPYVGYTLDELYKICINYVDKLSLSKDLGYLIREELIQKRGNEYWSSEAELHTLPQENVDKKTKPTLDEVEKELADYGDQELNFDLDVDDEIIVRPNAPVLDLGILISPLQTTIGNLDELITNFEEYLLTLRKMRNDYLQLQPEE